MNEVARAQDLAAAERVEAVGVVETAVHDGYRHACAAEPGGMQLVDAKHFHLRHGAAVIVVERIAAVGHDVVAVGLGGFGSGGLAGPQQAHGAHVGQRGEAHGRSAVGGLDEHRVVPLAHVEHAHPGAAQPVDVGGRYGQVVGIELDFKLGAALQRLRREELFGMFQRIGIVFLVREAHAEAIDARSVGGGIGPQRKHGAQKENGCLSHLFFVYFVVSCFSMYCPMPRCEAMTAPATRRLPT